MIRSLLFGVAFARAQSDAPENRANPFAGKPDAIAAGARLYAQTCQACHGGQAKGDRAAALTGALKHGERDGELFLNIRNGVRGTAMPPFAQLPADQVGSLVSYVRGLTGTAESPDRRGWFPGLASGW